MHLMWKSRNKTASALQRWGRRWCSLNRWPVHSPIGLSQNRWVPTTKRLPRHTSHYSNLGISVNRFVQTILTTGVNWHQMGKRPTPTMVPSPTCLRGTCSKTPMQEGLVAKEALAGEIMENETTKVIKETSVHQRWVLLPWVLTLWIPFSSSGLVEWSVRTFIEHGGRSSCSISTLQFMARCLTSQKSRQCICELPLSSLRRRSWGVVV